jgi:hypothetical protein
MGEAVRERSLLASVESFATPFSHVVGRLNLPRESLSAEPLEGGAGADLCAYGLGKRKQYQADGHPARPDLCLALASNTALKTFAIEQSQLALGCDLRGKEVKVNARRCIDHADYALSPHADCPKTICAILIYLWNGQRGTSLYHLRGHQDRGPAPEAGLQERVNNFNHLPEYQRSNLDVITTIKPDCFAYFQHVKTIHPAFASFLLIPNTRFRDALPDLPQSHHGVASTVADLKPAEARDLILIDLKLASPPSPTLRSLLRSRLRAKVPTFR